MARNNKTFLNKRTLIGRNSVGLHALDDSAETYLKLADSDSVKTVSGFPGANILDGSISPTAINNQQEIVSAGGGITSPGVLQQAIANRTSNINFEKNDQATGLPIETAPATTYDEVNAMNLGKNSPSGIATTTSLGNKRSTHIWGDFDVMEQSGDYEKDPSHNGTEFGGTNGFTHVTGDGVGSYQTFSPVHAGTLGQQGFGQGPQNDDWSQATRWLRYTEALPVQLAVSYGAEQVPAPGPDESNYTGVIHSMHPALGSPPEKPGDPSTPSYPAVQSHMFYANPTVEAFSGAPGTFYSPGYTQVGSPQKLPTIGSLTEFVFLQGVKEPGTTPAPTLYTTIPGSAGGFRVNMKTQSSSISDVLNVLGANHGLVGDTVTEFRVWEEVPAPTAETQLTDIDGTSINVAKLDSLSESEINTTVKGLFDGTTLVQNSDAAYATSPDAHFGRTNDFLRVGWTGAWNGAPTDGEDFGDEPTVYYQDTINNYIIHKGFEVGMPREHKIAMPTTPSDYSYNPLAPDGNSPEGGTNSRRHVNPIRFDFKVRSANTGFTDRNSISSRLSPRVYFRYLYLSPEQGSTFGVISGGMGESGSGANDHGSTVRQTFNFANNATRILGEYLLSSENNNTTSYAGNTNIGGERAPTETQNGGMKGTSSPTRAYFHGYTSPTDPGPHPSEHFSFSSEKWGVRTMYFPFQQVSGTVQSGNDLYYWRKFGMATYSTDVSYYSAGYIRTPGPAIVPSNESGPVSSGESMPQRQKMPHSTETWAALPGNMTNYGAMGSAISGVDQVAYNFPGIPGSAQFNDPGPTSRASSEGGYRETFPFASDTTITAPGTAQTQFVHSRASLVSSTKGFLFEGFNIDNDTTSPAGPNGPDEDGKRRVVEKFPFSSQVSVNWDPGGLRSRFGAVGISSSNGRGYIMSGISPDAATTADYYTANGPTEFSVPLSHQTPGDMINLVSSDGSTIYSHDLGAIAAYTYHASKTQV